MPIYSERLWPTVWVLAAIFPIAPALVLVAAPFSLPLGIGVGIAVYAAAVITLFARSAKVSLTTESFIYGSAMVETEFIGAVSAFTGDAARTERGANLDARAFTRFRAFMPGIVKIEIVDETDPTPYWLVSTRHPQKLAQALRASRSNA